MADLQTTLLFVLTVGMLVVGIFGVVWRNGQVLGLAPAVSRQRAIVVVLLLLAWLALLSILARSGFFSDLMTRIPPPIALALIPAWTTIICCVAVPALRTYLTATPMAWLIGYQAFRIVIEYILWLLYEQGLMPRSMTLEGQNIDIVVGVTAPLVALLVTRQAAWTRWLALVWNVAGLLILLNTITVAFQSVPGVFHDPTMQPPNMIVGQFPFIWLPTFVVPVALLGHFVALAQVLPSILAQHKQPTTPKPQYGRSA